MTDSDKTIVIIPTYNEKENIETVILKVLSHLPEAHILVVDDNSPDGTGGIIEKLMGKEPRLKLLARPKKEGLGPAYIAGFKWALEKGYDFIIQMDADLSHNPKDTARIFESLHNYDVVIGSRYMEGGGISGWPFYRKWLSNFGNIYARTMLSLPLGDLTGGFNGWRSHVLEKINLDTIHTQGYAFLVELKNRAKRLDFSFTEIPIHFEDRRLGTSKMTLNIMVEAAFRVAKMRFSK